MRLKGLGLAFGFMLAVAGASFSQHFPFYVLDGWGGVHAGGGAAAISPAPTYFGWDIAKAIEYIAVAPNPSTYGHGILVLDGYGGVHKAGSLSGLGFTTSTYFGWNIARDIVYPNIPPRANYSSLSTPLTEVTSSSYVSIRSVDLYLPEDGFVFIAATCNLANLDTVNRAVAQTALGVDSLTPLAEIEGQDDLHTDSFFGGSYRSVTRTQVAFVAAGAHTFHFLLRKYAGSGKVQYNDPAISVIYIDQNLQGGSGREGLSENPE